MFNLQGSEIIVILLLALVILGPEKLPDAVRKFAQTYGELKKMGNGFQSELRSVLDEPIREMKETARLVQDAADPKKIAEQAAEDSALREAAESADRAGVTDDPITEAALEAADSADNGTVSVDEMQFSAPVAPTTPDEPDEPDDGPPVVINQIAAANARGPIEPAHPTAQDVAADSVSNQSNQPAKPDDDVVSGADVTAR